jgi:hypothetical protein
MIHSEREIEGELHPCVTLAGLMVHPAHRGQGVARALTKWRLERARDGAVVMALIQKANAPSLANARYWATQVFGTLTIPLFAADGRPASKIEIREPRDAGEWDAAAAGLARFERGWSLRAPESGQSMRERAGRALAAERLRRYYIALKGHEVVGGFELFDSARLQTLVIADLPPPLKAANVFLRLIPRNGELRQSSVSRIWCGPGHEDVGRALWRSARSTIYGNVIGTQFDPRGPLRALIPVRAWTPRSEASIAVRSPVPLSEDRLVSPP